MSYPVSKPVYPGSQSHGVAYKPITVVKTDVDRRVCIVRDSFGIFMEVRCDIMRAKGNLPEPGEMWIIDRQYDVWVFGAILNGTTRGVEVSNVTGLPTEIDRLDSDHILLKAQTLGQIQAKGDILAATANSQEVVRQPAGALNQALVADPSTTTGLVYRDLCGRPVSFSGLPGATVTSRWVGTTNSGPPTAGNFLIGDWVNTRDGNLWTCTLAGNPGTWKSRISDLEGAAAGGSRIIARSYITASTPEVGNQALSTGTGYVRCYGPVKAGRLYRIGSMNMHLAADNVPVRVNAGLRISTDGTNTNTGGALYQQTGTVIQSATGGGTNRPEPTPITAFYTPSVDCTLSISLVPSSGSTVGGVYPGAWIFAGVNFGVDTFIEDMGPDPGA